ncbi:CDP-alcohol phosphatidyltransferase family protein [Alienimonas californiensis]|uniref:CDP-alcohol phosphatidyltransferase n=1 Tax=Alienimonas californiensis TaxID=2527989 RepID=A0A517P3M9_9PLAN|nr:CDP-alcohol phosphatidyltransferase family protein [Alienimonas californiensis]QDT13980.1 CDP-alcohol phosphatidyltransferase [Alienimonas californiensis]
MSTQPEPGAAGADEPLETPPVMTPGGRPKRRARLIAVLPTLLTLGNAACGFAAITIAAKVQAVGLGEIPADEAAGGHLFVAALLIFAAMVFDAFDGSAARLLGQSSELGAQLDSLCDALSFGVAPAFLMLQLVNHTFAAQGDLWFEWPGRVLWGCAVLFVLCAILRLARFNVETDEEDDHTLFRGLPSPAAAAVVAGVPLAIRGLNDMLLGERGRFDWSADVAGVVLVFIKLGLPIVTLLAAGLMVSRVRYPHVVNQFARGKRSPWFFVKLLFAAVTVVVFQEFAIPLIALWFAFSHPIRALWRREDVTPPSDPATDYPAPAI